MYSYSTLIRCAATLEDIVSWLASALGADADDTWRIELGALTCRVWPRGVFNTEDYDETLGGEVLGEVWWSVENRGDQDAYYEAERLLMVTVARMAVDLDASLLFLWGRDVVMMSRLHGELVVYDRFAEWFWPEVEPFLPPHRVSSDHWIV